VKRLLSEVFENRIGNSGWHEVW